MNDRDGYWYWKGHKEAMMEVQAEIKFQLQKWVSKQMKTSSEKESLCKRLVKNFSK